MVVLEMADHGLDGSSASHLASTDFFDRRTSPLIQTRNRWDRCGRDTPCRRGFGGQQRL